MTFVRPPSRRGLPPPSPMTRPVMVLNESLETLGDCYPLNRNEIFDFPSSPQEWEGCQNKEDLSLMRYGTRLGMVTELSGWSSMLDPGLTSSESSNAASSPRKYIGIPEDPAPLNDFPPLMVVKATNLEGGNSRSPTRHALPVTMFPVYQSQPPSPLLLEKSTSPVLFAVPSTPTVSTTDMSYQKHKRVTTTCSYHQGARQNYPYHQPRRPNSTPIRDRSFHQHTPTRTQRQRINLDTKIDPRNALTPCPWPYDLRGLYQHHPGVPVRVPRSAPPRQVKRTSSITSTVFRKLRRVWTPKKNAALHAPVNKPTPTPPPRPKRMKNSQIPHPPWGSYGFRSDDDTLNSDDDDGDLELWLTKRKRVNLQRMSFADGMTIEQYEKMGSWIAESSKMYQRFEPEGEAKHVPAPLAPHKSRRSTLPAQPLYTEDLSSVESGGTEVTEDTLRNSQSSPVPRPVGLKPQHATTWSLPSPTISQLHEHPQDLSDKYVSWLRLDRNRVNSQTSSTLNVSTSFSHKIEEEPLYEILSPKQHSGNVSRQSFCLSEPTCQDHHSFLMLKTMVAEGKYVPGEDGHDIPRSIGVVF